MSLPDGRSADDALRLAALGLLGRDERYVSEDARAAATLVQSNPSAPLRQAAANVLGRTRSSEVPSLLLSSWKHAGPSARIEILALLLNREQWTRSLLESISREDVQANEIPMSERQRLLQHVNPAIRKHAHSLFGSISSTSRAEVIGKYQNVLIATGDSVKGAEVFGRVCATCHALRGQGFNVGPNLAALRDKDTDYWLKNILDPNAVIEPRYVSYQIETKDGRSLNGIVQAETSTSLTLIQASGIQEKILRNDISEIHASGLSLMPEGLEQATRLSVATHRAGFSWGTG